MNVHLKRSLLVFCSVALTPNVASAFYAAQMGRWTSRDPHGDMKRRGMEATPYAVSQMGFVERDQFDPMSQYHDGMNLYQYVQSNPVNNLDAFGLAMYRPSPASKPSPPIPWPWHIDNEAEKRRGCNGNDCDHHCWAVCMTTYYTGCFVVPEITRATQDLAEICFPSTDWDCDILANEKGAKACAANLYDPVAYCDRWCGTKKCRK